MTIQNMIYKNLMIGETRILCGSKQQKQHIYEPYNDYVCEHTHTEST